MGEHGGGRGFRLEPLDSTGIFLGLGTIQCAALGAGIFAAVTALTAGAPLPLPVGLIVTAAGVAFGRVGGRAVWEWLPLLARWGWVLGRRQRRWVAPLPLWPTPDPTALPPCLDGLQIVEIEWRSGQEIGAVEDTERRTLTAAMTVAGPQFVVEPRPEQERLLAGWGDVMAQFAVERGAVTHIAWSELARPTDIDAPALDSGSTSEAEDAASDSYAQLVAARSGSATSHEVLVTITVARDRIPRHRGGGTVDERLRRTLVSSTEALLRGLRSAGLSATDPHTAQALQRTLRTRIAPHETERPATSGRLADRLGAVSKASAGPLVVDTAWDHVRVDNTWCRTWWIGSWPRLPVPPTWLEPFLSAAGLTRAMTVSLVPLPTHASRRRIERGLVALDSDATTKEGAGRRVDARHRRATQALLDREAELVAGFPEVAYCGLVTVSATTIERLDEQGEVLEQLARENGMDLRVLHARQDVAWAAALPLGLAPSTLLARR